VSVGLSAKLADKLGRIVKRHEDLAGSLATEGRVDPQEFRRVSKEYADLTPVVESIRELQRVEGEIDSLSAMLTEPGTDAEMKALAEEEMQTLKQRVPELEQKVRVLLVPKDEADDRNVILEVRAGVGGDEAALFARELYEMYRNYAQLKRWKFEPMDVSETGLGGYSKATAEINGRGVFARLKFESGAHRVQRVPATEGGGRVHTSAVTVAVLPEAEEVDIKIEDKDLRIDVFRAGGPGGQSVNTTDSAVRITHIPTGVVVQQQDEKSQHKNKAKAMKVLRARLYEAQRAALAAERAAARKSQVGSGDRSEKVRTFNFPQNRVTDHRIDLSLYKIDRVLAGELDELIDPLIAHDQAERLAEIE
jgi:peptide chain release factor 1